MPEQMLIEQLDALSDKSIPVLKDLICQLNISEEWIDQNMPDPLPHEKYHRNLLHRGEDYEIVVATWPRGTQTLPHDHGIMGSCGIIRVLRGEIFNQVFSQENGTLIYGRKHVHQTGELIPVTENLIHMMGFHSGTNAAMSLHIYSPIIVDVTYWDCATLKKLQPMV